MKELFLGSSQTQEYSERMFQRVKPEQVHIAVWTVEEVQPSSDSSGNDSGCVATSSPISGIWRGAGSESNKNVFYTPNS